MIRSESIESLSLVIGWIYFSLWTMCFYPQPYINYRTKSVVGLSFDFLGQNLTIQLFYCFYTTCLYLVPSFREAYKIEHSTDAVSVRLNDFAFTVHAVILSIFPLSQCIFYYRGQQRLTRKSAAYLTLVWTEAIVLTILTMVDLFGRLELLYYLTVVNIIGLFTKYVPQMWYNRERQTTEGMSGLLFVLDFGGGFFSLLQMLLDAYNHDDCYEMLGNPCKFGAGVLSMLFNAIILWQHYVTYGHSRATASSTYLEKL